MCTDHSEVARIADSAHRTMLYIMHTMKMHTLAPCSVYVFCLGGKSVEILYFFYFWLANGVCGSD